MVKLFEKLNNQGNKVLSFENNLRAEIKIEGYTVMINGKHFFGHTMKKMEKTMSFEIWIQKLRSPNVIFLSKITVLKNVVPIAKAVLWTLASSGAVSVANVGMQGKDHSSFFMK